VLEIAKRDLQKTNVPKRRLLAVLKTVELLYLNNGTTDHQEIS